MLKLMPSILKSRLVFAVLMLFLLLLVGVFGYRYLSNYQWIDAFYMTVITITTVGFSEVVPLDTPSKIFTIFLILTSVIIVGYAISIITEFILSRNNIEDIKQRKMQKHIKSLKNHIVICGFGRNGRQAAKKLSAYNKPYVIIDRNREFVDKFVEDNIPYVIGNANEDETLIEAGIENASTLICALPSDADNLFIVLSARQINDNLMIISRASQETSYNKLKLAGANNVILPDNIGGDHMASLVVIPDLVEFIDNLGIVGECNINIEEIKVEQLYNAETEQTICDLDLRRKTGCTVIGFKDVKGDYIVNPEADTKLIKGSKIIVLGRPEQIAQLNDTYNIAHN